MKKQIAIFFLAITSIFSLRADEGMWPLHMIQKIQDPMVAKGLKLSSKDIYDINGSSIKDGVVRLMTKQGRMFCTGEMISGEGLFLTNHHCGYGAIQKLSSPADNILSNGFWAKSKEEERPANFNVGYLRKIEDVTSKVMEGLKVTDDEAARNKAIGEKMKAVVEEIKSHMGEDKANYSVEISAFYSGNQYIAMYYEVYKDIRLVGTPPENVGKFGGETDNWRWPRHTCDFSMFRVYSSTEGKPAEFNATNQPYKPKHYFPVSIKGTEEGDFSMILGYPGRTTRYTYSEGIKYHGSKERPMRVQLRRDIMDVYESHMKKDKDVRLMYSDKLAGIGNYWNKYKGEANDLSKPGLYEKRKMEETDFERWVRSNNKTDIYGDVTAMFDEAYGKLNAYGLYQVYFQDGIANSQVMMMAYGMQGLEKMLADPKQMNEAKKMAIKMDSSVDNNFHEFYAPIEKEVLTAVIRRIAEDLDPANLPASFNDLVVKFKRDYAKMTDYLWKKSMFSDAKKMHKFLKSPKLKALQKDPVYSIVSGYITKISVDLQPVFADINTKLGRANRLFQNGLLEMNPERVWAPDANATMRLTYGQILSYDPQDGVHNKTFTTAAGIVNKYIPGDFEFDAPKSMIDMIKAKNYGMYADKDGELHTCFLSNNDITGGNSGSPVLNGKGELIGIAFDGNYEAISSDYMFMPDLQRTISVDIRYVLFVIDKLGGASNIIDELTLSK